MSSPVPATVYAERLARVRAELAARGLDGFVVPISDEHMSEYVGDYAQRMAWLTGFGGSAGTAAVLPEKAAVFVDLYLMTCEVRRKAQQEQELLDANEQLNTELAQARDENESLQLTLMEQEEKQGATAARIQALVERASPVSA